MDEPVARLCASRRILRCVSRSNLVKSGEAQACGVGRQYRRADGDLPLCTQDLARHRPSGHCVHPANDQGAHTYVLDLGANVDCAPEHLLQFGIMGASLVSAIEHKDRPTVGILNIGEEDIKGNDVVKRAGELLRDSGLNFLGQCRRRRHLQGHDRCGRVRRFCRQCGAEGVGRAWRMVASFPARGVQPQHASRRLAALIALPVLKAFKQRFDHAALQRCQPARFARGRRQESWLGGCACFRACPGTRHRSGSRKRRLAAHYRTHRHANASGHEVK